MRNALYTNTSHTHTHTHTHTHIYIYIYMTWLGRVGFYGISTILGNLMSNTVYTYILKI